MNVWEFSVPPCILCILLLFCLLYLSLLFSLLFFPFFWTELSWKLIKNVYLIRGPNKLMLQCPSLLHQMYMLFINWMYFICDNKLCWTWTWNIFKYFFFNESVCISTKYFNEVCKGPINNITALVQIMAWRWPCDKLLSEPMMIVLLMHLCVAQPRWINWELLMISHRFITKEATKWTRPLLIGVPPTPTPTPTTSRRGESLIKMCHQALMNKINSPLKKVGWVLPHSHLRWQSR